MKRVFIFQKQAIQLRQAPAETAEIKQLLHQQLLIIGFGTVEMRFIRGIFVGFFGVIFHYIIGPDARWNYLGAQHNSLKTLATAQRNVHLSMGECRLRINNGPVKGEALTFVYGNGPGKFERVLRKSAEQLFCHFFGLLIEGIFYVRPLGRPHLNVLVFARAADTDDAFAKACYFAYFTIVEAFFAVHVIFDKHHLCVLFAFKYFIGRVCIGRKFALNCHFE